MLLAVDVGNSTTVIGLFRGDSLVHHWRLSTQTNWTADEFALHVHGLLRFEGLELRDDLIGAVVASVVPPVTSMLESMIAKHLDVPSVLVAPGIKTGIPLRYENPREIGADRIANAVAAVELYGGPAIVVDFGTSTNFDAIDRNGEFLGGAIAPGVAISTEALVSRAAQLPEVLPIRPPHVIGRTTVQAIQSGIVYGFAGQVDAIVARIAAELGPGVTTVATGGMAQSVLDTCESIDHHDPWLTLKGLRLIWERNQR
ncbi:MAG: type III pantothenate kinase [Nitriliruptoraceae bacterium]